MSTPIILVGPLPSVTTGADTINNGPHSPASIDQNMANLRAAIDTKMPLSGTDSAVTFGSVTVNNGLLVAAGGSNRLHIRANGSYGFISGLGDFADNAAAISAGFVVGDMYRTGSVVKIVI